MLVAVAGLSAAGKTTAVEHLEALGVGRVLYVGRLVHEAVRQQGLTLTPANERRVREELRRREGADVFAARALESLRQSKLSGAPLIDAICVREEADRYRRELSGGLVILAIEADFEKRAARAASRPEKPLDREDLVARDRLECETFRLLDVLAAADHRLSNNGELADFKADLSALAATWRDGGR
ncbi:AAA family ATPase [Phenylobacterium sp. LjRoot219]|uniref:AAA family ATPase n=1 Tax=Phenylobacterium sp. LjRoot219 TaxID=3342283 RepID=UPI003ECDC0FC